MYDYELVPVIDIFFKGNEDDSLIASVEMRNVSIEELCRIFGQGLLTEEGAILIEEKHEKRLENLSGIKISTCKCDAFIDICNVMIQVNTKESKI